MIPLECRWRGDELPNGRYACLSPKLTVVQGVDPETHCANCYCRDHEPPEETSTTPTRRIPLKLDCKFRGGVVDRLTHCCGGREVYACALFTECTITPTTHAEKTYKSCSECGSYVKRKTSMNLNCAHRGPLLIVDGQPVKDVFTCDKHERCSVVPVDGVRQCAGCVDYSRRPTVSQVRVPPAEVDLSTVPTKFDPPARRHLIYHVYPATGNGVWQRGVQQLGLRRDLFDGSRTLAVVTGPGLDPPETVDAAARLALGDVRTLFMPNDPTRREVVSWWPLWRAALQQAGPDDAVFYAHSKGATRQVDPGNSCQWWASLLYHVCLDYWPHVSELLQRYEIAGPMKKHGYGFGHQYGRWHYSGTFFWARAGGIRQKISRPVPQVWFGTEAWPGMVYSATEAGCIFHEGVVSKLNLYDVNYWRRTLLPAFEEWQNARARHTLRIPVLS